MSVPTGGYIALYRSLLEHPLMNQLPAAWFRVFIAILLKVNWKSGTWWDGTNKVTIPAGSCVTSTEKLRKIANVSAKQVRGCLQYLATAKTAAIKTTSHYTVITLLNWDAYQGLGISEGKPEDELNIRGQAEGKRSADSWRGNGELDGKPDGKQNVAINGADRQTSRHADSFSGEPCGEPNGKAGAKQGQAVGAPDGNNLISNKQINQSIKNKDRLDDSSDSRKNRANAAECAGGVVSESPLVKELPNGMAASHKDETLLRWALEEFVLGSTYLTVEVPDETVNDILAILLTATIPVSGFIEHVGLISHRFRPGGSMEFKKWGAFVSTARNFAAAIPAAVPVLRMDYCRHNKPDGQCSQCNSDNENDARMEAF